MGTRRYFTFWKSAARVSGSAISSLESELGVKLFKRTEEMSLLPNMENPFLRIEDILQKLDASVGSLQLAGKERAH